MKFKYVILFSVVLYTLCIRCSTAGGIYPILIKTGGLFGDIAFSPDSRYLALSGEYLPQNIGGTKLFDVPSWREIDIKNYSNVLGKPTDAAPIAWSPDSSNLFVLTGSNDLAIVDVRSSDVRSVWKTPYPYQITALLPITNEVIALIDDGLDYYDVGSGKKDPEFASSKCLDLEGVLHRVDGDLVFSSLGPNVVRRNIKSGKTIESKDLPGGAISLTISRNQKEIAVAYIDRAKSLSGFNSKYVQLLNASDLGLIGDSIFVDDRFAVDRILFDHDGQSLILLLELPFTNPVTKEEEFDTLVERLDLKSQQLSRLMPPIRAQPKDMAESNDGRYLACSTSEGIYILDFKSK
jgi:WD40 repeat protein